MKKIVFCFLIVFNSFLLGQEGAFTGVKSVGGSSSDYGYDIFATNDGCTYVTGKFKSNNLDFGNGVSLASIGNYDIYVAKFDPEGKIVWAKQAGGPSVDEGRAIAVDATGNVIVTGVFTETVRFGNDSLVSKGNLDIFIAKYDSDGNFLWVKHAHTANQDKGTDIVVDKDDNYIITGYFGKNAVDTLVYEGLNIVSNGERDVFVLKLYTDGTPVWGISGGGVKNDEATGIAIDNSNNIYISGYYKDTTSVFGNTTLPFEDGYESFVTKIDPDGNYVWANGAYGAGDDRAYALDITGNGDSTLVVVTGAMEDTVYVGQANKMFETTNKKDIFIYTYTSSGFYIAGQTIGGSEDDYAKTISFIPESDAIFYVGGYSKSSFVASNDTIKNYGKKDVILFSVHKDDLLWIKNFGGSSDDYLNSSVVDSVGNIYFAGNFKSSSALFDTVPLTSSGGHDIWFAAIKKILPPQPPTLFINEFLASNDSSYFDVSTNNYPDWIEIYNASNKAVDIGGMYITDDLSKLILWKIPDTAPDTTTIPAGGYIVLLADKKTNAGVLHVNLKLSGNGDQIGLTLADSTTIVDSLSFGKQITDVSMGRLSDGSSTWGFFSIPSPGASNSTGTVVDIAKESSLTLITEYELRQNYPNPFNPTTTINYSIPIAENQNVASVQLKIYDVLGKEVASLVNEVKISGNYSVQFDASKLSSGVYYYQLSAGDFVDTKKMLLLK